MRRSIVLGLLLVLLTLLGVGGYFFLRLQTRNKPGNASIPEAENVSDVVKWGSLQTEGQVLEDKNGFRILEFRGSVIDKAIVADEYAVLLAEGISGSEVWVRFGLEGDALDVGIVTVTGDSTTMTEIAEGGSANVQESHKLVTVEQLYEQMGDGQIVAVKIILGLDQDRLESCGTQSCTRIKRDFPKYEASNGDFTGAYNAGSLMKPQDTQNGDQYLVGAVIGIKVYE